ncbi:hypothetical protein chiPu_0003799 [Chiloscyllium punctatum]|uniref:ILEI/PANDER domain-containing protein n=1 Tax=Chiloscyllium punctatum TaxID=137246 RepID=A0A401S4W8_CHIPU|nr:hypothetical protein [Chiloscyllium punctatum]
MIEFIKKAPDGSLILMATFDNRSTRLNEEAKKYIEELGSKLIRKLHFRGNWVFLGTKGFTLPENFQREKTATVWVSKFNPLFGRSLTKQHRSNRAQSYGWCS